VDYTLQILKRDHEESLEIANKRKGREDKYDWLRKILKDIVSIKNEQDSPCWTRSSGR
jgi:cytolysin (calcineurin-like family phosphatase)